MSRASVYSPALYTSSTRIWQRCGYEEAFHLNVMERSVTSNRSGPTTVVVESKKPNWDVIMEIDRHAFQGFWRMSLAGLTEAMSSTTRSVVLTVGDTETAGYAIVGAQWNVSYLQRIAFHPEQSSARVGSKDNGTDNGSQCPRRECASPAPVLERRVRIHRHRSSNPPIRDMTS